MSSTWFNSMPGISAVRTATHRNVFLRSEGFLPGGRLINGSLSRDPGNTDDVTNLRNGLLMGKITATGLYAPSVLGVTTNAEAIGSTSIEAAAGVITELVRRVGSSGTFKLTGPPTAGGVVVTETVTYSAASGTTITCTAILNAFVAGSLIQPTDGSETPITLIPDIEGYGIPVVDRDGNSLTVVEFPRLPVSAVIDASQIINYPADTSTRAWIKARFNDVFGGQWVFDDGY